MSFDQNPKSPDKLVEPAKRTTKVNFGVAIGVLVFLILGALAVWIVARNETANRPESTAPASP